MFEKRKIDLLYNKKNILTQKELELLRWGKNQKAKKIDDEIKEIDKKIQELSNKLIDKNDENLNKHNNIFSESDLSNEEVEQNLEETIRKK